MLIKYFLISWPFRLRFVPRLRWGKKWITARGKPWKWTRGGKVPRTSASANLHVDSSAAGGGGSGSSTIAPDTHGISQQGISSSVPGGAGEVDSKVGGEGGQMGSIDARPDNGRGDVTTRGDHNVETVSVGGPAQSTEGVHAERGVDGAGDNGGHLDVGGGSGRSGQATDSGLDTESEDDPNEGGFGCAFAVDWLVCCSVRAFFSRQEIFLWKK